MLKLKKRRFRDKTDQNIKPLETTKIKRTEKFIIQEQIRLVFNQKRGHIAKK